MIRKRNAKGQIESIPLETRLWERIIITEDCWLWNGAKAGRGLYPVIRDENNKQDRVSRIMLRLYKEERPSEKHIACHMCDNPNCVNPDHLFWGTVKINSMDASRKGRSYKPSGEHLEKIRKILFERWKSEEYREKMRLVREKYKEKSAEATKYYFKARKFLEEYK